MNVGAEETPAHVTVRAQVLGHMNPDGPKAGPMFHFFYNAWMHREVVPGKEAFLFVRSAQGSKAFPELMPVIANDAVMVIADHQSAGELGASIRKGFRAKAEHMAARDAGKIAKDAPFNLGNWRAESIQSPITRSHMNPWGIINERLTEGQVAEALLSAAMGTPEDLSLFGNLLQYENEDLDQWILDWMASAFAADYPKLALHGLPYALRRWGVPDVEERVDKARKVDITELEDLWQSYSEDLGLPPGFSIFSPVMRAERAASREQASFFTQLHAELYPSREGLGVVD